MQPLSHTVAASITYGCSLYHIRLQVAHLSTTLCGGCRRGATPPERPLLQPVPPRRKAERGGWRPPHGGAAEPDQKTTTPVTAHVSFTVHLRSGQYVINTQLLTKHENHCRVTIVVTLARYAIRAGDGWFILHRVARHVVSNPTGKSVILSPALAGEPGKLRFRCSPGAAP